MPMSTTPLPDRLPGVELLASKWTIAVLDHLSGRVVRFGELRAELGKISQKSLSVTLKQLEKGGYVERRVYALIPPRVEYSLTSPGEELLEVLAPVREFVHRQAARTNEARRPRSTPRGTWSAVQLHR